VGGAAGSEEKNIPFFVTRNRGRAGRGGHTGGGGPVNLPMVEASGREYGAGSRGPELLKWTKQRDKIGEGQDRRRGGGTSCSLGGDGETAGWGWGGDPEGGDAVGNEEDAPAHEERTNARARGWGGGWWCGGGCGDAFRQSKNYVYFRNSNCQITMGGCSVGGGKLVGGVGGGGGKPRGPVIGGGLDDCSSEVWGGGDLRGGGRSG